MMGGQLLFQPHSARSRMKKVEAIIKPFLLESVKDALQEQGFVGMTISEIKDFGHPGRGTRDASPREFFPRLKLEVVVANADVEPAIDTIRRSGMTLGSNDHLFVQQVDDVIRIRTAEHGETAI